MLETLDKLTLAWLGAASMTREKAEEIFDEYVKRGQVERGRREGFVNELLDSAEKTRKELEDIVGRQIHAAIEKVDLPTREDISRLESKIDAIAAKQQTSSGPKK